MRIIWEEEDIKTGMMIIRSCAKDVSKNIGYARTVSYVIGWSNARPHNKVGMMNFLSDGMFRALESKKALMEELNNDEYGYRFLTNKEINLMLQDDK